MQKTGLTLPQALRRLKKADDSVREAIGEDIETAPARAARGRRSPAARRLQLRPPAAAAIDHHVHLAVQLEERRRQLGRDRAAEQPLDARRLRPPGRDQDDRPRLKDRRHPHRQRLARHGVGVPAEQRGIAAPGLRLERHPVRPRLQRWRRLVETDVAVGADAEDLQVDAAGRRDRLLVARALRLGIRRGAVEKIDLRRRPDVHAGEEVLLP